MNKSKCSKTADLAGLSKLELEKLVGVAKVASKKGGEILMSHYGHLNSIKSKGRVGDLVTNADLSAEKIILDYLNEQTPNIGVLAEESGCKDGESSLKWCVDPLDGTTNFAHGYPLFATSIGLTWQSQPILGSISIPFLEETYWGAPGIGVFCNDQPIKVTTCKSLIDSLLVTGFAYDRHTRLDNNYAEFCWLTHRTRGVRRGGAAAVDLAFVAAGRLDGYWERGLAQWDLAAGTALVDLAGGYLGDYRGGEMDIKTGRVIACSHGIKDELLTELAKVKPLNGELFGAPEVKTIGS